MTDDHVLADLDATLTTVCDTRDCTREATIWVRVHACTHADGTDIRILCSDCLSRLYARTGRMIIAAKMAGQCGSVCAHCGLHFHAIGDAVYAYGTL